MTKTQSDFIKIITAYYGNTSVDISNMNIKELFEFSKINNLGALVFYMIKEQLKDNEMYSKFEAMFLSVSIKQAKQVYETNKLIQLLNEHKIEHILIKGIVLRKIYTPCELRSMGDVDILIHPENRQDVHNILLEMDYSVTYDEEPVYSYENGAVHFEIHTKNIDTADNKPNCSLFLEKMWDNKIAISGYTYELLDNYNFVYLLLHLLKHINQMGSGARFYLDIALYMKQKKLDFNYINEQIKYLDLEKFAQLAFSLCNKFTGIEMPKGYILTENKILNYFEEYCLSNGIFGLYIQNTDVNAFRIRKTHKKNIKYFVEMIYIKIKQLFPTVKTMKRLYPKLQERKNINVVLLLGYYVHRILFKIRTAFVASFCKFFGINLKKDETTLQIDMFKRIGL